MKKSVVTLFSILLVASLGLAACTPAATTSEPATATIELLPTSTPTPAIDITVWYSYSENSSAYTAFNTVLEQAAADLPQYNIQAVRVAPEDIYNNYINEVAAGNGPDLLLASNDILGDYVRSGLIADVTIFAAGKLGGFSPIAVDSMVMDGLLYGIPASINTEVLWYNKQLMPTPPSSTEGLQFQMESGTPVTVSFGCYDHYGFFGSFGGKIFDENWTLVADQGTGVSDAMTYLSGIYQIDIANNWPVDRLQGSPAFTSGTIAAITNSTRLLEEYRNALGDNLAVTALPHGPIGPATPIVSADGFYVNPVSAHQKDAVDVALYLTGAAAQTVMAEEGLQVPARADLNLTDPVLQEILTAINSGITIRPQEQAFNLYWTNFCDTDPVFSGEVTVEQWITAAAENARK